MLGKGRGKNKLPHLEPAFRPSWAAFQSQNPRKSAAIPVVLLIQSNPIRPKFESNLVGFIFAGTLRQFLRIETGKYRSHTCLLQGLSRSGSKKGAVQVPFLNLFRASRANLSI